MTHPRNRQEFEDLAGKHAPLIRKTVHRVIGGKAGETDSPFSKEDLEYTTEEGDLVSLSWIETGTCSFGHVIGANGAELAGRCEVCGALVCSSQGCIRTCERGCVCCGRHARVFENGAIYCTRHAPGVDWTKLARRSKTAWGAAHAVWGWVSGRRR